MNFEQRKHIVTKLGDLEEKYPVDQWKLREVHVWPVMKLIVFFSLFNELNKTKSPRTKPKTFLNRAVRILQKKISALLELRRLKLRKASYIFSGASSHRVVWKDRSINRYFDPLIDFLSEHNKPAYLFEYDRTESEGKLYSDERVFNLHRLLPAFKKKTDVSDEWQTLQRDPQFSGFMKEVHSEFGLSPKQIQIRLLSSLRTILDWENLYSYIFRKVRPAHAVGLCYYNNQMFGMNLAASKYGIQAVDMQHGSQGFLHPGYYYRKVPEKGYNILPSVFWCWTSREAEFISQWGGGHHKGVVTGNPWINFLEQHGDQDGSGFWPERPIVLFTLQPLKPAITANVLEAMKNTADEVNWWLRFHPRMTTDEIEDVRGVLADNGLLSKVEIPLANELPLPVILKRAKLHVSRYSGAIQEAAMMNLFTLIVDQIGAETFSELIGEGHAANLSATDADGIVEAIRKYTHARSDDEHRNTVPFGSFLELNI